MNPVDLYQFFTALLRDGPEVIVAAGIALLLGIGVGWKFWGWWGQRKIEELTAKRDDLATQLLTAKDQIDSLKTTIGAIEQQVETLKTQAADARAQRANAVSYVDSYKAHIKNVFDRAVAQKTAQLRSQLAKLLSEQKGCLRLIEKEKARAEEQTRLLEQEQEGSTTLAEKLGEVNDKVEKEYKQKLRARQKTRELKRRLEAIVERGGKGWKRAVGADAPAFVPLGTRRRCPIISLLNLKGGVGKTTLTLNLAATLTDQGKRVLMIDCDHQRSLSLMCVTQKQLIDLHVTRQTLQHFLLGPDRSSQVLHQSLHALSNMPSCSILINTASQNDEDGLANVEDKLMIEWLTSEQENDVRHILRGALHDRSVTNHFDFILLDCPPRLSTATINALAASDYVLIPVGLDALSATNALPLLLRELRSLRAESLFPDFGILGIVANKVNIRSGALVRYEQPTWNKLPTLTAQAWGESVHRFEATIKDDSAFARAAKLPLHDTDTAVAIWEDAGLREQFCNLTREIQERITDEAPHRATLHT